MPRALWKIPSPLAPRWPGRGRLIPASALITLVLPEPERPNNPTTGASARNATASSNAPKRCSTSTLIMRTDLALGASRQPFRCDQRADRQHYRNRAEPQRLGVPAGRLHERVNGERKRLGLSRDVRDESDRRSEFPEASRERQQYTGDDARQPERQCHRHNHPSPRGPTPPPHAFK